MRESERERERERRSYVQIWFNLLASFSSSTTPLYQRIPPPQDQVSFFPLKTPPLLNILSYSLARSLSSIPCGPFSSLKPYFSSWSCYVLPDSEENGLQDKKLVCLQVCCETGRPRRQGFGAELPASANVYATQQILSRVVNVKKFRRLNLRFVNLN